MRKQTRMNRFQTTLMASLFGAAGLPSEKKAKVSTKPKFDEKELATLSKLNGLGKKRYVAQLKTAYYKARHASKAD